MIFFFVQVKKIIGLMENITYNMLKINNQLNLINKYY